MLLLVSAGRDGGGGGPPVYFTVPWSPHIAERGELPGECYQAVLVLLERLRAEPHEIREFREMGDTRLLMSLITVLGFPITVALGVLVARHLLTDLEMWPAG